MERKNHPGKGRDGEYTERSGHAVKLYQHAVADNYPDMDELCRSLCLDRKDVDEKLASIDYEYDPEKNQYV